MSAARGATKRGRARAKARKEALEVWARGARARPLRTTTDHGGSLRLCAGDVQAADAERWIEPFLAANRPQLERLHLEPETRITHEGVLLELHPSDRIGAIPLLSPATRKVAAGVLVKSRFGWPSVGQVLGDVGYRIEPEVGQAPLVPGSAREVPPWILAGPALARIATLVRHLSRSFVEASELRENPRGRVDWTHYARRSLPTGRWQQFQCTFPDLTDDPWLLSTLRWTVHRLATDLEPTADTRVGRRLLEEARLLLRRLGAGAAHRPSGEQLGRALGDPLQGDFLRAGLEAVGWVRDERGLGGARTLDGLAWSLATDRLWEAWVEAFFASLAQRVGARFETAREGGTRRPLVWKAPIRSLGHLAPDVALQLPGKTIWVDAKYKAHMIEMERRGWGCVAEALRAAHRADLHQALAYAALSDAPETDTWLVYPVRSPDEESGPRALLSEASLSSGSRRVRLFLAGLSFGFRSAADQENVLRSWEQAVRVAA